MAIIIPNVPPWLANPPSQILKISIGLAFAIGFAIGYMIVERMWKKEGLPPAWIDSLLIYTMLGTVIGAKTGLFCTRPSIQTNDGGWTDVDWFRKIGRAHV